MVKKTSALLIGVILLASVIAGGCVFNVQNLAPLTSPSVTYDGHGFSIKYPTDWTKTETKTGPIVVFFDLPTKNATENLNVQVWNTSSNETFTGFTGDYVAEIQNYPNFHQIDAQDITVSGTPALKITYTATIAGDALKLTQVLTVKNGKEYIVTYQASPANHDRYASVAQQMIDSFQIR